MAKLDYRKVKALFDAREIIATYGDLWPEKKSDRTYEIGWGNYRVQYSQQEVLIPPGPSYRMEWNRDTPLLFLPEGVGRVFYRNPFKEYITFDDRHGVKRYYIVPNHGLRIQRDGQGWKAMNPIPDYHIEVDRAAAREARKPAEDLITYVNLLWDMIERPTYTIWGPPDEIPDIDDRKGWQEFVTQAKYAHRGWQLSTVQSKIREKFTSKELAFSVIPVPDTETDHSGHWDQIDRLRAEGRLIQYEGEPKKKNPKAKKT